METVFLANQCVLEGFDDPDKAEEFSKAYGPKVEEALPFMHQTSIKVVKYDKEGGFYVIKAQELKDLKPEIQILASQEDQEKEERIKKLQEELARLTSN